MPETYGTGFVVKSSSMSVLRYSITIDCPLQRFLPTDFYSFAEAMDQSIAMNLQIFIK